MFLILGTHGNLNKPIIVNFLVLASTVKKNYGTMRFQTCGWFRHSDFRPVALPHWQPTVHAFRHSLKQVACMCIPFLQHRHGGGRRLRPRCLDGTTVLLASPRMRTRGRIPDRFRRPCTAVAGAGAEEELSAKQWRQGRVRCKELRGKGAWDTAGGGWRGQHRRAGLCSLLDRRPGRCGGGRW